MKRLVPTLLLLALLPLPAQASSQSWSASEIAAALPAALAVSAPEGHIPAAVLDGIAPTLTGTPEAELDFSRMRYDALTRKFSGSVLVKAGGQIEAQLPLTGRIVMSRDVPVLSRALPRNTIIGAQDISWLRVTESAATAQIIDDPEQIIGMSLRSGLRAGMPLRPADLQAPSVITRGSLVSMIYRTGTLELTAKGRALQDAALGDAVRVVNLTSSRTIEGIAQRDGSVLVSGLLTN